MATDSGCRLSVSSEELDLDRTLGSGQAFLWRRDHSGSWIGPIKNKLFRLHRVSSDEVIYWKLSHDLSTQEDDRHILTDYFRLSFPLVSLYKLWAKKDENFSKKSSDYSGIRLLSQHPLEALVAFISSSNNNIQRIHSLMIKLCQTFGDHLGCYGDQDYYTFPSLPKLCGEGVEQRLRDLGFGYRAKYIYQTAMKLSTDLGGQKWLHDLKDRSYHDAWQLLQQFPGVGGKVADCICLMALGHMEAVPVDVHMTRIALRDYSSQIPSSLASVKSLSASNYKIIGDHFRSLFGDKAGWAQSVLFAAEIGRNEKISSKRRNSLPEENFPQKTKKMKH